jgi:hypothetical protein
VGEASRRRALEAAGLVHPHPDAVRAPLFAEPGFFLAADKVQVKYEMLRAHVLDAAPASTAATSHGYSRAGFYLVAAAFSRAGMGGLPDDKRGRRGPVKLTGEIEAFLAAALRRAACPARSWPSKWPPGSGSPCTAARWNGPGGGEHIRGRARSPVLASG